MANFNNVLVVGRLTRDPVLQYAPSGAPVCTFTVATSRRYTKEDGGKGESTTFLDVDVWRRLAEICNQFLKKGRQVLVMGSLKQSRWIDEKTQQPRSKIRIVAQTVQFLWSKKDIEDESEELEAAPSADAEK